MEDLKHRSSFVKCPVCCRSNLLESNINQHMDSCLKKKQNAENGASLPKAGTAPILRPAEPSRKRLGRLKLGTKKRKAKSEQAGSLKGRRKKKDVHPNVFNQAQLEMTQFDTQFEFTQAFDGEEQALNKADTEKDLEIQDFAWRWLVDFVPSSKWEVLDAFVFPAKKPSSKGSEKDLKPIPCLTTSRDEKEESLEVMPQKPINCLPLLGANPCRRRSLQNRHPEKKESLSQDNLTMIDLLTKESQAMLNSILNAPKAGEVEKVDPDPNKGPVQSTRPQAQDSQMVEVQAEEQKQEHCQEIPAERHKQDMDFQVEEQKQDQEMGTNKAGSVSGVGCLQSDKPCQIVQEPCTQKTTPEGFKKNKNRTQLVQEPCQDNRVCCPICGKSLERMSDDQRNQHAMMCIEEEDRKKNTAGAFATTVSRKERQQPKPLNNTRSCQNSMKEHVEKEIGKTNPEEKVSDHSKPAAHEDGSSNLHACPLCAKSLVKFNTVLKQFHINKCLEAVVGSEDDSW